MTPLEEEVGERERLAAMLEEDIVNMVTNALGHEREGSYATDLRRAAAILRTPSDVRGERPVGYVSELDIQRIEEARAMDFGTSRRLSSRPGKRATVPLFRAAYQGGEKP